MVKINLDKHIWEGWTVGSFINELEPTFNMIMRGQSCQKPFKTKDEVKAWCKDNQPYYKKHIPDLVNYFVVPKILISYLFIFNLKQI